MSNNIGSQLFSLKGRVFAIDKSKSKVKKLEEMCHRLNWSCVRCFAADSTKLCDISGIPFHSLLLKLIERQSFLKACKF